jgi:hypothetical protein
MFKFLNQIISHKGSFLYNYNQVYKTKFIGSSFSNIYKGKNLEMT